MDTQGQVEQLIRQRGIVTFRQIRQEVGGDVMAVLYELIEQGKLSWSKSNPVQTDWTDWAGN